MEEVSNNLGDSVQVIKEGNVNVGEVNMEALKFRCDRRYASKKDGMKSKNKNKGGVGPVYHKMLSVDSRPSVRKRPRLDFDPNGLDPFGLDALLGLINNNNSDQICPKEDDKEISTGGFTKEGPASQSIIMEETMALKSVQDEGSKVQLEDINIQSTPNQDQSQAAGSLKAQEQLQVADVIQSTSATESGDINIEVDNTIDLGAKVGVQLDNFKKLVTQVVEEEGLQPGNP
ncbi:hypothetical protein Hanom_Chr15g01386211 [Helianthus anomalus]